MTSISTSMSMSKTCIGGAVCREFESEAPAAEETLDWVVCSSEQFCFQMCFECGDGGGTFSRWSREFQTVGAAILKALDWKLILAAVIIKSWPSLEIMTLNKISDYFNRCIENIPAKNHPDLIWNDAALSFFLKRSPQQEVTARRRTTKWIAIWGQFLI